MKFRSKIDWWIHLVLALLPAATVCLCAVFALEGGGMIVIVILYFLLINLILIVPVWAGTYYVLDEHELRVKCGVGKPLKILYRSIGGIRETKSALASPALSLDRVEIVYGRYGRVLVSPRDKQEFMRRLDSKIDIH